MKIISEPGQPDDPQRPMKRPHAQNPLQALDRLQAGAGISPDDGHRLKLNIGSERLAKRHWWKS